MFQYIYIHHIFFFFFFFWLHHTTCRILVPRPRIEPGLPTVEAWSLNHWSTREFPYTTFCLSICWWTYAWYPYLGYYEISCQQHETELSLWDPDFSSFEWYTGVQFRSVQFSSVAQSCPTLCDPMNHSTPGLPVHHQLPESNQTHVHQVGDAIQPSHPLSSPSPLALNLSQHQGVFQWVSSLHQVAKVLEFQLQHQSFQWIPRTDLL